MNMNFDLAPNRRGTNSVKWDAVAREFGMVPGEDILPLWVADMDFFCAPELLDAVRGAFAPGALGYRSLAPGFYDAIVGWMRTRHGLAVDPAWILPLPGVIAGLSSAVACFTEAGDGVIVQPPIYPPFVQVARSLGRTVLENRLIEQDDGGVLRYAIDFDQLRALAARPDAKMMVLCSPHNPIGRVWSREELTEICQICAENGVYLVSDEIHSDIMLDGARFTPTLAAAHGRSRICQLGSPSKSFNTAGTHAAYMIVPDADERAKLRAYWGMLRFPTESFMAGEVITAAYGPAGYYADELCAYLTENMNFFTAYLRQGLPGIRLAQPQATYLLWADFRGCGVPADQVHRLLCDRARVALDPGEWFDAGCQGYTRINVAMPRAMLAEASRRIVQAVKGQ